MSLGLPEEKRKKAEALIREVAGKAHEPLAEEDDEQFFNESREFAAGIARGILILGYERDWRELSDMVDKLFRRA